MNIRVQEPQPESASIRDIAINSLAKFVGELRKQEKLAETEKTAAAREYEAAASIAKREYESAIEAAKARREERQARADASLSEIRPTLEVLDPARAKLAEQAAE